MIETIIKCPNCGTTMDVKDIKRAIKEKIDAEMNDILLKL